MPRRRRPPRPGALADLSPARILTQIVVLQLAFYVSALVLLTFTALAAGKAPSVGLLLDWTVLRGDITDGWMFALVWMLNSLVCVIYLLLLIARSKLVPDFALTIHFVHLVASALYTRAVPRALFWWGLQAASAALMTSLGIWSCQWRELRPFSFGGGGTGARANGAAAGPAGAPDEGEGFEMGKGAAGRGRDGAGAYEMV